MDKLKGPSNAKKRKEKKKVDQVRKIRKLEIAPLFQRTAKENRGRRIGGAFPRDKKKLKGAEDQDDFGPVAVENKETP